jgi:hypothetical protein
VSVYAVMSVAWGAGAFIGPRAAGAAMDLTRHELAISAVLACAGSKMLALGRRRGA